MFNGLSQPQEDKLIRFLRIGTSLLMPKKLWFTHTWNLQDAKVHGYDYFGHVPTFI